MAYLRKRSGSGYTLVVYWNGKKHPKALHTNDPAQAERLKQEAEEQLQRIRNGESPQARQLLDEGFSIVDVLFGCPEIDKQLQNDPEANPLTLRQLSDAYLEYQFPQVGPDERYNSSARFKKLCTVFGDDRRVMTIRDTDLAVYREKRVSDGINGTSLQKELVSLKAAIDWAVRSEQLSACPISDWPKIKVRRRKRFEWKSDIDRMIAAQSFESAEERRTFLREMSARMVLTAPDMRDLVDLARTKQPQLVPPLMMVCATGMRRKEMVLLQKEDFDPIRGTLILSSGKQSRTEEVTTRTVVLPRHVSKTLARHAAKLKARERMLFPIFGQIDHCYNNRWVQYELNCHGKPLKASDGRRVVKKNGRGEVILQARATSDERRKTERATRLLDKLIRGTEFELMSGWHCLRHSFISLCVSKGLTWEQIAEWVGHVSRGTTRLYTHFYLRDSRRRIESLGLDLA